MSDLGSGFWWARAYWVLSLCLYVWSFSGFFPKGKHDFPYMFDGFPTVSLGFLAAIVIFLGVS